MLKRIFQNKNIAFLFSGQLISQIGDSMFLIGLMWLVLDLTGSKAAMGTVALFSNIPMLLFGLIAGVAVDRYNRKRIMVLSDLLRAIIILIIPVTYFLGVINIPIIICTAFLLSTVSSFFNPARDSLVPELAGVHNLVKANSLIQSSNYVAILFGPVLAAAIISLTGVVHLFSIDAFTFLLSLVTILFIKYKQPVAVVENKSKISSDVKEIIKYIHSNKKVRSLLLLTGVNNFFIMGPAIVGIPIFVKEVLLGDASTYAIVESSYGIGMFIGSFVVNYIVKFYSKGKILLIGMIFDGLTYTVLYIIGDFYLMILAISFHAIGIPLIVVTRTSLFQEWTKREKLGRVFSLVNMSVVGVTAITTGFTGILAEVVDIQNIFAIFGTGGMLCGILGWFNKDLRNS